MELVTVFRTFSSAEAQLVRSRLEAAEIIAVITHEGAGLSIDGYSMAAGGILVQVPADRVEDARALLASRAEGEGDGQGEAEL
ncbi:MAG TPA: DUF2007 domain-containing protein [Verrucomicrobiota bacterium]|nr:DUF2007 domain-containing protein [Verrucomicrobiota bacterium]HNU52359.1 DUF2007 domain-containing protein [Verrucomicrobiota bacterium]